VKITDVVANAVRYAATLHYAAAISGFLMLEYQGKLLDAIDASLVEPIRVEASQIPAPGGPGLGVQLNEAALAPHWRMIE